MGRDQGIGVHPERDGAHRQVPTAIRHLTHRDDPKKSNDRTAYRLGERATQTMVQTQKRSHSPMANGHSEHHDVGKSTTRKSVLMDSHQEAVEG